MAAAAVATAGGLPEPLKPTALCVRLPPVRAADADVLSEGMRELYRTGGFADVELVCQGQSFLAHKVVLCSQSEMFKQGLMSSTEAALQAPLNSRQEVRLADINSPEAVKLMLDYMYLAGENFSPGTLEVDKDVMRLARNFRMPGLGDRAIAWLAKDLTTANVVERLAICEEFQLATLREKILEVLTNNKKALGEVARHPQLTSNPRLMQALLCQCSAAQEAEGSQGTQGTQGAQGAQNTQEQPARKKAKKG